jgi:acyl carrier protein
VAITLSRLSKAATVSRQIESKQFPGKVNMQDLLSPEDSKAVIAILTRELDVEASQLTDDARIQEDLGADSLTIVEINIALEEHFNISIPDERLERVRTVGEVFELLAEYLQKGS